MSDVDSELLEPLCHRLKDIFERFVVTFGYNQITEQRTCDNCVKRKAKNGGFTPFVASYNSLDCVPGPHPGREAAVAMPTDHNTYV